MSFLQEVKKKEKLIINLICYLLPPHNPIQP